MPNVSHKVTQGFFSYLFILKRFHVFCNFILGTTSRRENDIGSWFVYAIALAFMKHARNDHLEELYGRVLKSKFKISYFYSNYLNELLFC